MPSVLIGLATFFIGLEAGAPTTIDAHGDPLPAHALLRLGTSRFRHGGTIHSVAYSADGRLLATGNTGFHVAGGASVVVWDADTGRRIHTSVGHAHVVRAVAFSRDNKQLAVVNGFGHAVLWDLASGKETRLFETTGAELAMFTPDGAVLLVADGKNVRRWDLAAAKELEPLRGHEQRLFAVATVGKTIATCAMDGTVRLWDGDGRETRRITIPKHYGLGVALSPDGKRLACGTFVNEIHVWDTETGQELWRVKTNAFRVTPQAFSPDGKTLVTGGDNLTWWNAATGKVVRAINGQYGTFHVAACSPDGKRIVTAGDAAAPRFWELSSGKDILRFEGHQHAVRSGAFTPDGKTLATVGNEAFVQLRDLSTGKARRVASGEGAITSMALAPDGKTMVTSTPRGWPSLWDLSTGKHLRRFDSKGFDLPGGVVCLSADGKTLASSTGMSRIRLWDAATGQEHSVTFFGRSEPTGSGFGGQFLLFVLSPDGKSVATTRSSSPESGVIRWDVATGEKRVDSDAPALIVLPDDAREKKRFKLADRGEPAAFSPDGRLVAVIYNKEVSLIEAATGLAVRRCNGDGKRILCAAFSPDGRTVATSGDEGVVHLWEVASGESRGQCFGHDGPVYFVAFAPDGRRLASGGEDHTALIWDLTDGAAPGRLTAKECDALWIALAGPDAAKAFRAIWTFGGDADQAVAFLKARLRPVTPVDPKRLAGWIDDLGSDAFEERRQATLELDQLAEQAVPALRQALNGKIALEFRRRAENLLAQIATQAPPPTVLRQLRALEILEHAGTAVARQVLRDMAQGAPQSRVTRDARAALGRLARSSP